MTAERYLPWPRDPRLLVGDHGTVIGLRGRPRTPTRDRRGYLRITHRIAGTGQRQGTFRVHVMVLETFRGPRPAGMEGAHGNGDQLDCRAENLRWATPTENSADRVLHGTLAQGERHGFAKLTEGAVREIRRLFATGLSSYKLAALFGVSRGCISGIVRRTTWAWLADTEPTEEGAA